jgi:hypothetical protein
MKMADQFLDNIEAAIKNIHVAHGITSDDITKQVADAVTTGITPLQSQITDLQGQVADLQKAAQDTVAAINSGDTTGAQAIATAAATTASSGSGSTGSAANGSTSSTAAGTGAAPQTGTGTGSQQCQRETPQALPCGVLSAGCLRDFVNTLLAFILSAGDSLPMLLVDFLFQIGHRAMHRMLLPADGNHQLLDGGAFRT